MALANWSGNHVYEATELHRPESLDGLRALAATSPSLRALGSRHSFTAIGDAGALVSLERLPGAGAVAVDRREMTATVGPAVTYAQLGAALDAQGLALENMASLPHISVAGAIATATHGSGDRLGNLATAVRGLTLVGSSGEVVTLDACDPRLPGAAVHLGALGIVTRVTLAVVPGYAVRQDVYEGLEWEALLADVDAVFAAGRSVSVFHDAGPRPRSVWVKSEVAPGVSPPPSLLGARPVDGPRHPLTTGDPANTTAQLGVPGPWHERLPHFRSGYAPSSGAEIQSEVFVDRTDAVAAIEALLSIGERLRPHLRTAELRTIAGDELWLSPQHGRDTLALHFTWRRDPGAVRDAVAAVESALAGLHPRPHWGKALPPGAGAGALAAEYPRLGEFAALRAQLDPRGAFVNAWLREHLPGAL